MSSPTIQSQQAHQTSTTVSTSSKSATSSDDAFKNALGSGLNQLTDASNQNPSQTRQQAFDQATAWQDAYEAEKTKFQKQAECEDSSTKHAQQIIRTIISKNPAAVSPKLADLMSDMNKIYVQQQALTPFLVTKNPAMEKVYNELQAKYNSLNDQYNAIIKPYLDPSKFAKNIPALVSSIQSKLSSDSKTDSYTSGAIPALKKLAAQAQSDQAWGKRLDGYEKKVEQMWKNVNSYPQK